jgi:hypothetical protein
MVDLHTLLNNTVHIVSCLYSTLQASIHLLVSDWREGKLWKRWMMGDFGQIRFYNENF